MANIQNCNNFNCRPYNDFIKNYTNLMNADVKNGTDTGDADRLLRAQSECIKAQLNCVSDNLNKLIDFEKNVNKDIDLVNQLNEDSMNMYSKDYYYIVIKGILYFIILALFIYFYGIFNLIQNIKTTAITVKDTAIKVKDSIKNKVIEDTVKS
jgi:hypothetical protein